MEKKKVTNSKFTEPILISIPEFARLSGLSYSVVRQLVAQGELPLRVIRSRQWIIRAKAIEWLHKEMQ